MTISTIDGKIAPATFDYIVIGGGSGGCAVASRLSEDPSVNVCLLEAGKVDKNPLIHMPAGVVALMSGGSENWAFETVPQPGLNGRKGYQPRGRTLGGSSSINAMVYIRGHRLDYDRWANQDSAPGWAFDDVLPYFKKLENFEPGADDFHAVGGPLNATTHRSPNPINERFLQAGEQLQLPRSFDFNGEQQEGLGWYHVTQKDGQRHSAAKAYIHPNLDRPNLFVITNAHAKRLILKDRRATGVEIKTAKRDATLVAKRETILAAGAFQTPQLMMLSGIGPGEHLKHHGIEVVHDLPGVGENLQDHIDYVLSYKTHSKSAFGVSLLGLPGMTGNLFRYLFAKTGMLTTNFTETGGFLKSSADVEHPDLQLHFVIAPVEDHGRKLGWGHGFSCHVCVLRPKSKGTVRLASNNPFAAPLIDPNFLADSEDAETLLRGVKLTRRLMRAPAFDSIREKEMHIAAIESDDALLEDIRNRADTVYHPVGTCRMGSDAASVVDTQLRVRGLEGLRISDASVMPSVVSGNTNAPTMMIGERCADFIKYAH